MTYKRLKMIAVSEENYIILKGLGRAGDSFNDVITEILKQKPTNRQCRSDQFREPECSECEYNPIGEWLYRT
jgi:predicted CopG family antitoxin